MDLPIRIMNTAGECKRWHQVHELAHTPVTDIRVGAITADEEEWLGNAGQNPNGNFFWIDEETGNALNALGLPNPGMAYCRRHLPKMVRTAHEKGKRLGVNISGRGKSPDEYAVMTKLCVECNVDVIEVNVGCPNVFSAEGKQKPIASFDPEAIAIILKSVRDALPAGTDIEVHVKLSPLIHLPSEPMEYRPNMEIPLLDTGLVNEVAVVFVESGIVVVVVSTNTVPKVYAFKEDGTPALSTPGGIGGLSGPIIKERSIEQNRLLSELLPPHIERYGAGGISVGGDVKDFADAGCTGVQVGTAWMRFGNRVFGEIVQQYVELQPESS